MERNGLAVVFILLILVFVDISDASLISSYRNFAVKNRDSLPGSSVPIQNLVSGDKKLDDKTVNDSNSRNKLNPNEPSKENKLGSETEKQTSVEDKKPDTDDVNKNDKDTQKSDSKIVKEESKETKPVLEPVEKTSTGKESEPGTKSKPISEEKPDPMPAEEPRKEELLPEKKQSEEDKKSGTESEKVDDKEKKPETKPVSEEVSKVDPAPPVPKDSLVSNSSSDTGTEKSPSLTENTGKKEEDKLEKDKKKTDDKSGTKTVTYESCDGVRLSCTIQKVLVGCIKSSDDAAGSEVVVIVQNNGDINLKANVAAEDSGKGLDYEVPKKQSKVVSVPITNGKTSNIVLRVSDIQCKIPLHEPAISKSENPNFLRFPTYEQLVTPVNGAYLLIFSAVIFGGAFACIKFSKRRQNGGIGGSGIRYQELEMGIPESVSVSADLESAEGWDEGWDDDWDDDNATVKSPVFRRSGNISANGLTSRAPTKDAWEEDWDE